jgi:hypothetical protein
MMFVPMTPSTIKMGRKHAIGPVSLLQARFMDSGPAVRAGLWLLFRPSRASPDFGPGKSADIEDRLWYEVIGAVGVYAGGIPLVQIRAHFLKYWNGLCIAHVENSYRHGPERSFTYELQTTRLLCGWIAKFPATCHSNPFLRQLYT